MSGFAQEPAAALQDVKADTWVVTDAVGRTMPTHDDVGDPALVAAYGPNLARLRAVKQQYDPENVFHLNVNIPPDRKSEVRGQE